jgi:tetratricopeptide (TPR) repeat protein
MRCLVRAVAFLVTLFVALDAARAADQDSLNAARDLYASAAYEEALAVLNRLPDANRTQEDVRAIEQYRAFCLLALGRTAEAERAMEAVIAGEPNFHPAESDVSPRVRAAFSDVRRRMLPGIIQQKYQEAKATYDRKNFLAASQAFKQVLDMMNDPDAVAASKQPPLSDLKTLAMGFRDLAVNAAEPPPLPAERVKVEPPAAAPPLPPPAIPNIYSAADTNVLPPVVILQDLPAYPGQVVVGKIGMIEVVIDEHGQVESAIMRKPVSPSYDALALATAKTWKYRPAVLNGIPVKYRKAVQVTVRPQGRSSS